MGRMKDTSIDIMEIRKRQDKTPDRRSNRDVDVSPEEKIEKSDLRGDKLNIAILFFLYLLQGIPIGLTAAIPMLLQNRGATYKQQVGGNLTRNPPQGKPLPSNIFALCIAMLRTAQIHCSKSYKGYKGTLIKIAQGLLLNISYKDVEEFSILKL